MIDFKQQIDEDIEIIQNEWKDIDLNVQKPEYAFNYWVLNKLYDLDEEIIPNNVVEYNDKNIDCFVHYEDSKELFLIQNKYYGETTFLNRKEVADFLETPLSQLKNNNYKRSKELQDIFNEAILDSEYKIWLHFYITNSKVSEDIGLLIKSFNLNQEGNKAQIRCSLYDINGIKDLYYGESFKENVKFKFTLDTINKGTVLRILPEQYNLTGMSEAYYIMTPVIALFELYRSAVIKQYPIFEENIREYLGKNSINNGIIQTLKTKEDRKNFFYYNNGITMICDKADNDTGGKFSLTLYQPQIVNGCQTVNTIREVLNDYPTEQLNEEFEGVYVMVKVLVVKENNPTFYQDIVKYTNRQNSINENAFGASHDLFLNLQSYFQERGFLLLVKPSDKNKFKELYKNKTEFLKQISKANEFKQNSRFYFKTLSDITIPLDKFLQVIIALIQDGHAAYSKKSLVLKPTSETYKNISTKIQDFLSVDNMIRLYLLYRIADIEKNNSEDKKTPIPYYLIGFLGHFMDKEPKDCYNNLFEHLFSREDRDFFEIFDYLKNLTNLYKKNYYKKHNTEYNSMIKKPIDNELLAEQIETLDTIADSKVIKDFKNALINNFSA
jgi:hypothetical protein